jgi:hypothetical protein
VDEKSCMITKKGKGYFLSILKKMKYFLFVKVLWKIDAPLFGGILYKKKEPSAFWCT